MKYLSLFSGIGGFEYGLQQSKHPFECVGYSEIDNYAMSIYEKHYPNHINYGDARTIRTEELPNFDLLVGGFPCQAFSIAGKQGGFNDCRGTLFFEIARILRDKAPRYFLLENVKGLLGHDKGKTFKKILEILDELGYDVSWSVYNSKDYGVPQNRERVFIKGYFRERCGQEILHSRGVEKKGGARLNWRHYGVRSGKVIDTDGVANCLTSDEQNRGSRMFIAENHEYEVIRKLTPRECERLQGFEDDWTRYGKDGEPISDAQRYKCIGNAVTTTVITHIADEMFDVSKE